MFYQNNFTTNLFQNNDKTVDFNFQNQLLSKAAHLICQHGAFANQQIILNLSPTIEKFLQENLANERLKTTFIQTNPFFFDSKNEKPKKTTSNKKNRYDICAEIENLPFMSLTFDRIITFLGLNFVNDRHECLRNIYDLLKPDGIFLFVSLDKIENSSVIELISSVLNEIISDFNRSYSESFFKYENDDKTKELLEAAGFTGVRIIKKVVIRKLPVSSLAWLKESGLLFGHYLTSLTKEKEQQFFKILEPKLDKMRIGKNYVFEDSIKLITAIR